MNVKISSLFFSFEDMLNSDIASTKDDQDAKKSHHI